MSSRGCLRSHDVVGLVRSLVWVAIVSLSVACTDTTEGSADGGRKLNVGDGSRGARCASDDDCSDGLFCDGVERCVPGNPSADSNGCLYGDPPCTPMQTCDEVRDRCLSNCDRTPDADGDGHRATNCGGDDCDDADPQRFPGNTEVCDPMRPGHDEDCDPMTFANSTTRDGDRDMDGFIAAACCNTDRNGMRSCGRDCNDVDPNVRPDQSEACNGRDDNCNGDADEGLGRRSFCRDTDGDMFGDGRSAVTGCTMPLGYSSDCTDCDDGDRRRNPGAPETCDGVDNDCDGSLDEGLPAMVPCYRDSDGDGRFGTRIMTCGICPPSSVAASDPRVGDCCDDDPRANSQQRSCFTAPIRCGGFDYDCDGRGIACEARWILTAEFACDRVSPCTNFWLGSARGEYMNSWPPCGSTARVRRCAVRDFRCVWLGDATVTVECR